MLILHWKNNLSELTELKGIGITQICLLLSDTKISSHGVGYPFFLDFSFVVMG